MTNDKTLDQFRQTGKRLFVRPADCMARRAVQDADERTRLALTAFFAGTGRSDTKLVVARAIARLCDWLEAERSPSTLSTIRPAEIERYLEAVSNEWVRANYRTQLHTVFNIFAEKETTPRNPVSTANRRHGGSPGDRVGFAAIAALNTDALGEHMREFRLLVRWAERQRIFDLRDFSPGDAEASRERYSSPANKRNSTRRLRHVFEPAVNHGLIAVNPFRYSRESENKAEGDTIFILMAAQKAGEGFVEATRRFIDQKKQTLSVPPTPGLNHFGLWLTGFTNIAKLQDVTVPALVRYREVGMANLSAASIRNYFPCVVQYFGYLHAAGLVSNDLTTAFGKGRVLKYERTPRDIDPDTYRILFESKRKQLGRQADAARTEFDFSDRGVFMLPFADRLSLARFTRFVGSNLPRGEKLSTTVSCVGHMMKRVRYSDNNRGGSNMVLRIGDTLWDIAERLGAVRKIYANRHFTRDYSAAYNSGPRLLQWAGNFLEKDRYYAGLYFSGRLEGALTEPPTPSAVTSLPPLSAVPAKPRPGG